jgi:hypothetical protein
MGNSSSCSRGTARGWVAEVEASASARRLRPNTPGFIVGTFLFVCASFSLTPGACLLECALRPFLGRTRPWTVHAPRPHLLPPRRASRKITLHGSLVHAAASSLVVPKGRAWAHTGFGKGTTYCNTAPRCNCHTLPPQKRPQFPLNATPLKKHALTNNNKSFRLAKGREQLKLQQQWWGRGGSTTALSDACNTSPTSTHHQTPRFAAHS